MDFDFDFGRRRRRRRASAALLWSTTNDDANEVSEVTTTTTTSTPRSSSPSDSYDVVIVGSGIGGLSCAAMLAKYGYKVAVFEAHYSPGGAAHGFTVKLPKSITSSSSSQKNDNAVFHFDSGPSFFSGLNPDLPPKASNPLRTILDVIDERVECLPYTTFGLCFPEGNFVHTPQFGQSSSTSGSTSSNSDRNNDEAGFVVEQVVGQDGVDAWQRLMRNMEPLAKVVDALPTAALRGDVGAALTAGPYLKNFAGLNPLNNLKLTTPFQSILDESGITKNKTDNQHEFLQNWLDLLTFCLSGLPADGTITAEMAMMMGEFYADDAVMDCPVGGSQSIVDALVRGIEKHGGTIFLNTRVEEIIIDKATNQATGVKIKTRGSSGDGTTVVKSNQAVVSNLSVWDLYGSGIVDKSAFPSSYIQDRMSTPSGKSFMHLHVGFKATKEELESLQAHYMYIDDWSRGVEAEDNAALISIPSVHDDTLAPVGYGVLHIYTPATEDYSRWDGLDRRSDKYTKLKEERSQYLWDVLDKVLPFDDFRTDRVVIKQVGTPLTHKRFLNRYQGSYGPAIRAGEASFPFPGTPVKGLLVTGDSCFPGIGVPAVAGSGFLTANSVSFDSLKPQIEMLESMRNQQMSSSSR